MKSEYSANGSVYAKCREDKELPKKRGLVALLLSSCPLMEIPGVLLVISRKNENLAATLNGGWNGVKTTKGY